MSKEDENLLKTLLDKKKAAEASIKAAKNSDISDNHVQPISSHPNTEEDNGTPLDQDSNHGRANSQSLNNNITCLYYIFISLDYKAIRTYTITQNGFPNPLNRQSICWDLLTKATSEDKAAASLADKMKILQDDQDLKKAQVLEYLGDFIPWMINSGALINACIYFKDKTSDITQSWKNNIFKMLFQS
ncbi:hypothetical protein SERLADRAFT_404840 [Serpula lacrymans var. lacrymans S7.9]|uniref:Uncharacterized protein n=1 Tax=Serpula lacrymans var. lacrymans (strain S7.9) TaxID=578457 RepID=F8NFG9_SERL9|nr:uncharacterized protein SERLADRAFT_404840 [Serpula lacrymans var. lacrymans S7.9]EGO30848.1 hypothetical protein SERLADRAFT_404840 [Serpula lacrymans var. lacrymans S7.9]